MTPYFPLVVTVALNQLVRFLSERLFPVVATPVKVHNGNYKNFLSLFRIQDSEQESSRLKSSDFAFKKRQLLEERITLLEQAVMARVRLKALRKIPSVDFFEMAKLLGPHVGSGRPELLQ